LAREADVIVAYGATAFANLADNAGPVTAVGSCGIEVVLHGVSIYKRIYAIHIEMDAIAQVVIHNIPTNYSVSSVSPLHPSSPKSRRNMSEVIISYRVALHY